MKINRNMHVSLAYTLRSESHEGNVVEATQEGQPLEFIYGAGLMLPKFEEALLGLSKGDDFKIEIPHLDGYGPTFEERIVELPKNLFEKEGKFDEEMVAVGNILPMMDGNGNRMDGKVLEVAEETVKMDFNHPMAGQDLFFTGSVLDLREATEEELAQIAQMQAGAGGCGSGGCGDCGDGGCGDGADDCGCDDEAKASCGC